MRLFPRTPMILLALAPLGLAGAVAGPAAGATAVTATDAGCSGWNGAQPVDPAAFSPLESIAAVSPCNAWAVGFQENTLSGFATSQTLIEHWTGSSWTAGPTGPGGLSSVSAVLASDVWAAGGNSDGALILHYDGTGWTRTPTPHDGDGSFLNAVDGRTASDAWAGGGDGSDHALLMHWDGTNWSTSSFPAGFFDILSVSADSATDVWALAEGPPGASVSLLHWNGSQWQSFPDAAGTVIESVTALSPTSAWAVGFYGRTGQLQAQTLTEHWDGSHWTVVPSPSPGGTGQDNVLTAVTAASGSDVWATGHHGDVPLALHWNGGSWTTISLPLSSDQAAGTSPVSISVAAPGQAWVAGTAGLDTSGQYNPFAVPVPVVPDVTGQTVSAATSALTAAGLTVSSTQNTTTNCTPSVTGNNVVGTDPAAGQQAPFSQAVTLTVCSAVVINPTVTVPDVTGELDASARSDITAAGLTVGTVTLKADCTIPRGQVISQSPAAGTQAPFGTRLNLTEATRSGAAVHQVTPHACTH